MTLEIVFLQRGNVVIGQSKSNGLIRTIGPGAVIRRWGTSQGIGQLQREGPTSETVLDRFDEVQTHEMGIVMTLPISDSSKWPEYLR